MSTERLIWALLLAAIPAAVAAALSPPAAIPAAVAAALSPPNVYARVVVGLGVVIGAFPAAYLVAGLRA